MINVNALLYRVAAECQSTEETRYYLNGVYIQPHPEKGALLIATDGHRLIVAHDEGAKCTKAAIIALDKRIFSNKMMEADKEDARVLVDDDGISTVGVYRSPKNVVIDGTFPDYAKVVAPVLALAKEKKFASADFNQAYLAAFAKIGVMLRGKNMTAAMRVSTFTESDPALIRFGSIDHVFGILMPMRGNASSEIPIFMKPILEPAPSPVAPVKTQTKTTRRSAAKKKIAPRKIAKKVSKRRAA